jgi:FtsX-like permease family
MPALRRAHAESVPSTNQSLFAFRGPCGTGTTAHATTSSGTVIGPTPSRTAAGRRARSTIPSAAGSRVAQPFECVALLVGAVGVANIMIISVLERRSEIGLRRALGATRAQIRTQFLAEAIMLALMGGAVGVIAGAVATVIYAATRGWQAVIPPQAWAGGIGAAIAIGALAGLLPALRAVRMSPTEALRTV